MSGLTCSAYSLTDPVLSDSLKTQSYQLLCWGGLTSHDLGKNSSSGGFASGLRVKVVIESGKQYHYHNKLCLAKDLLQIFLVKFKDWLKAINTKRGLSFSYLTNFVQNQKLIK